MAFRVARTENSGLVGLVPRDPAALARLLGQHDLRVSRPVPEQPVGCARREQISHLAGEVVQPVAVEVRRRGGQGEVAGDDALGVADEVRLPASEDGARLAEAGADEYVLESVGPLPRGSLAGAAGGAEVLRDQRPDLRVRYRRRTRG